MYKIEYKILLDDESGRPYIDLPKDYSHQPEDRFFSLELTRYFLQDTYSRRRGGLDDNTEKLMVDTINLLGQISDNVAEILYDQMRNTAEMSNLMNDKYQILVNNIEERDSLPEKNILYEEKIFDREIGFKVCVISKDDETHLETYDIYELVNGISNDNWVKINK